MGRKTSSPERFLRAIRRRLDISDYDLVHAHTLVSNGLIAQIAKKRFGVPYIVSVRNTDLNTFLKRPKLYGRMAASIVEDASAVISINPAYKQQLGAALAPFTSVEVKAKTVVVPNGIDDYWLEGFDGRGRFDRDAIRLLYVGEFTQNKNLHNLIRAIEHLNRSGTNVSLRLIGDGPARPEIGQIAKDSEANIVLSPWTTDRDALRAGYRECDIFAMPSFHETFGLVYIEALSQGIPIIYSAGQGVDGFFEEGEVGHSVDPAIPGDIARGIREVVTDYPAIAARCPAAAKRFSWARVGSEIADVYMRAVRIP